MVLNGSSKGFAEVMLHIGMRNSSELPQWHTVGETNTQKKERNHICPELKRRLPETTALNSKKTQEKGRPRGCEARDRSKTPPEEPALSLQDQENCNASPEAEAGPGGGGDGFPALACSLEEKLSLCFRPSGPGAEPPRAAVRPITECSLLQGDEIWNALTDNYGNVMPVDWKSSHTRTLHLLTLNLSEKRTSDSLLFDTSDDEELREQLDMHSIIVSCVNDEPLFTADQVIEEIEEMMQESPDPEDDETPTQSDRLSMLSQEIQTLKRSSTSSYEERVKRLSVSELNELLEEIETAIKEYSEELVQQLALRDELEFEKEVKNSFISVLIEVQNKQKEHRETAKKKKKLKNSSSQNGKNERSHLPGTLNLVGCCVACLVRIQWGLTGHSY
ncbi:fasciculation and elongation protein zeta-2 isoform X4 [Lagenorhynchus albirostris]|uniref:fasciculation and elongation protein zeta-2 isoform X4 n=1 Tax=Lagenorhynchus albirostris TaxID=27610 RepID=UPI0028E1BEFE|nr:fasciculation and elongation protein zeta-2 isoform X4 [Lagenorhynchus albirostris]